MALNQTTLECTLVIALTTLSGSVAASGFALDEQGVSGLGNAYAGSSAAATDESTVFYNPAGMSRLSGSQFTIGLHGIQASSTFSDGGSSGAAVQTQEGNGGDTGQLSVVPNVYMVAELDDKFKLGLGINSLFGAQKNYEPTWMGRFQAEKSGIQTLNFNPSIFYQISDMASVGAGLSYQSITGELSSTVNYSALAASAGGVPLLTAVGGAGQEGVSTVNGSDSSYGYNLGTLINFGSQTRIGLAYHSQMKHTLGGGGAFSNVPSALAGVSKVANGDVSLELALPETFSSSMVYELNPQFDLLADVTWTGWSVFKKLDVVRSNGTTLSSTPENWRNTWRGSVGATQRYGEQWTARLGVAYDQTPVSDTYRNARVPDQDRTWFALGGQYKLAKDSAVDFGYAHLFMNGAAINQNKNASGAGTLLETYSNHANIYSLQYGHKF